MSDESALGVDIDGFLVRMLDAPATAVSDLAFPKTHADAHQVSQLQFLLKNAIVPLASFVDRTGFDLKYWSRTCFLSAIRYTNVGIESALGKPDWADFFCAHVKDALSERYPAINEVVLHVNLKPRMYAWSVPTRREVHLSAVTREILLRINTFLVNVSYSLAEDCKNREPEIDPTGLDQQFTDYLMHYLLCSFKDLNYSALPVCRPQDKYYYAAAMEITKLQIEFMIAHEYGHVAYEDASNQAMHGLEDACDEFAYGALVSAGADSSLLFLSLRWLFLVVSLERIVGEIQYYGGADEWDERIDWMQEAVRRRDRTTKFMQDAKNSSDVLTVQENFGSALLFAAKGILYDLGPTGVSHLIQGISSNLRFPTPVVFADRFIAAIEYVRHESKKDGHK